MTNTVKFFNVVKGHATNTMSAAYSPCLFQKARAGEMLSWCIGTADNEAAEEAAEEKEEEDKNSPFAVMYEGVSALVLLGPRGFAAGVSDQPMIAEPITCKQSFIKMW